MNLAEYLRADALALGITSFLSQISPWWRLWRPINNMLQQIWSTWTQSSGKLSYAQIPMAVVGIVMKFFQIVISIVVGMAAGCIPIVGFNMGAGTEATGARTCSRSLLTV